MGRHFLVFGLILAASCGGWSAQAAPMPSEHRSDRHAISDRAVASLQGLVKTRYRQARQYFLFNEDFSKSDISRNPFSIAVDNWNRQLAACTDNACRYAALSSQLSRLNFSLGRVPATVADMPLKTGSLLLDEHWYSGQIAILPVGDGSIVVVVFTVSSGKGGTGIWDCSGIVASGVLSPGKPSRMTIYDEDKPVSFDLQVTSPTSVELSENAENKKHEETEAVWPAVCTVGPIYGKFRAEATHRPGRAWR